MRPRILLVTLVAASSTVLSGCAGQGLGSSTSPPPASAKSKAAVEAGAATGAAPAEEAAPVEAEISVTAGGRPVRHKSTLPAGSVLKVASAAASPTMTLVGRVDGQVTTSGGFSPDAEKSGVWRTQPLPPQGSWKLTITRADGSLKSMAFETGAPTTVDTPYLYPSSGTYGVGMPISVHFDAPVQHKARVQKHLSVQTSKPIGAAAWSWIDADTVVFLPDKYWPAYTDVTVNVDLEGVQISDGVWGKSVRGEFTVGRELIMYADLRQHTMDVTEDGKTLRTLPISGGKAGWETAEGVKVVSELFEVKRLQNLVGPETWDVTVPWAMRLTYSGEFIHSAPWNSQIGSANTSHGCTNLTTEDAAWLFKRVRIGDIVETTGSPVTVEPWNGLGGVWNQSWASWKAGSYAEEVLPEEPSSPPRSTFDYPG